MKINQILIFCLLTVSSLSNAGPSISGGSGTGSLKISSGYRPGAFSVSVFSAKNGILDVVLKYYIYAGAQKKISGESFYYEIPGQQSALITNSKTDLIDLPYYQLNFELIYSDLLETTSSFQNKVLASTISFCGVLAESLYFGMEKGGAHSIGQTIDQNGNFFGEIFEDKGLFCQKNPSSGLRSGTWCSFNFKK